MSAESPREWSVMLEVEGRSGSVLYREPGGELSGFWEFGGDDTIPLIVTMAEDWSGIPGGKSRREEILRRVGQEVVRQTANEAVVDIPPRGTTIYFRAGAKPTSGE